MEDSEDTPTGPTMRANTVNLYVNGKEICAMIGPDPVNGVAGYGHSAHEALRELADMIVNKGVWVEVTDVRHPWRAPGSGRVN
jgi:hypothetical protein